jgi:hypothetical protein
MEQFETGAVRDTGGKGRMDLLPMVALIRVSKHMEDALTHYPERNWEKGLPMHSMIDSAFRHLAKYVDGWTDEDHLCAAATNLLMAMWTEEKLPNMQDIPSRGNVQDVLLKENTTNTEPPYGCDAYDGDYERCLGTKEREICSCGGNPLNCDFYEDVREKCKTEIKGLNIQA